MVAKHTRLLLQFHITGKCNLRCRHCYRTEGDVEELSYNDLINVIEQFKVLLKEYNFRYNLDCKGHVNITGGEPFFRKDIKTFLKYLGENSRYFSYGVLSNGSFIDDEMLGILKSTGVSFVQMSIDGDRQTHDSLRAPGDYDRVFKVAKLLNKNGIRNYISFTANSENYKHLPSVAETCRRTGVTKLWSDRLVPIGNGSNLETISKDTLSKYIESLKKAQGSFIVKKFSKTEVSMNRALQFQNSDGQIYSCSAGKSLITVDEFGNIMPCRRLPVICSNVFDSTLKDVYFNNETFKDLRRELLPKECRECNFIEMCKGGARCQSFAKYGSFYRADPACPYKKEI